MEVNGIPIVETPKGEGASRATLGQNFDNFLTLLTTQLKNQDPLSPLDTTEFTNQLTQFAQVEQGLSTNKKLDQLIGLSGGNQLTTGVSYIGKIVEADGDRMVVSDRQGKIGYSLEKSSERTTIAILSESGSLVRSLEGSTEAGDHEFIWDGKDDAGNARSDGVYTVLVTALDASSNNIKVTTSTFGRVTGVEADGDDVVLKLGTLAIGLDQVRSVTETS